MVKVGLFRNFGCGLAWGRKHNLFVTFHIQIENSSVLRPEIKHIMPLHDPNKVEMLEVNKAIMDYYKKQIDDFGNFTFTNCRLSEETKINTFKKMEFTYKQEFKVGDRVRYIGYFYHIIIGGTIMSLNNHYNTLEKIVVKWDDGTKALYNEKDLELVETNKGRQTEGEKHMYKFEIGDKVRIRSKSVHSESWVIMKDECPELIGTVKYNTPYDYDGTHVEVEISPSSSYTFLERDLELYNPHKKTFMNNVNNMMKVILDADMRKLIKAGYVDGDLQLTAKGREALDSIQFTTHKEALVKLAQEDIDEEKENKK